jgi:hypothetical protein
MGSLYARPSDIKQPTWTLTAGTAQAPYPVTNLGTLKPYQPFKATSGTATARATFGGATALHAIVILSHNLAGVTIAITNSAGLSTTLVVPANTLDGLSVGAWKNLVGVALTTATTWDLAIVGHSADVAIGEVLLIGTARTLNASWGLKRGVAYPIDEQRTELDVPLIYELGVQSQAIRATVLKDSQRADVEALQESARGRSRVWWLARESTINKCNLVRFASPLLLVEYVDENVTRMAFDVVEAGLGPAL